MIEGGGWWVKGLYFFVNLQHHRFRFYFDLLDMALTHHVPDYEDVSRPVSLHQCPHPFDPLFYSHRPPIPSPDLDGFPLPGLEFVVQD